MTTTMSRLALLSSFVALGTAAQVGYFDSDSCIDPAGIESCYADTESAWADCVDDNCEDQNIDCINVCSCIRARDEVSCAATHCWDRVYGCEYQQTAGDIATYCLNPDLGGIPFYPPPDRNAPGACLCNLGKLLTSLYRSSSETESCGRKGEDIVETLTSNDDIQAFTDACICCSQSVQLSSFFEICPDTDPSLLGLQEIYQGLVVSAGEDEYLQCADAMSVLSCGSDGLDFTPPGGDDSASFYEPDSFPSAGTETLSNESGVVSAPVSGETFTWTYKDSVYEVTVASADAEPTANSENDDNDDDGNGSNDSNESNSDDGSGGDDDSQTGNGDGGNDDEDAGAVLSPRVWVLVSCVLAATVFI